ncbi:hypothetical protein [uncultured Gammaproteobacteria bacterium]|nr:hypothetical protein [uncultured Gammaproteobacteria bacterium]
MCIGSLLLHECCKCCLFYCICCGFGINISYSLKNRDEKKPQSQIRLGFLKC